MFRKIIALVTASLMFTLIPAWAAPIKSLAVFKTIPADQDIAGMLVGDSAIYLYGNTPTGGYVTALNKDGSEKWQHSFNDLLAFTISTGALDASGNIWLAGASAPPIAMPGVAGPSPTAINPDGVVTGAEGAMRGDLTDLTLWKVSPTGEGAGKYQLPLSQPLLPTSMSINKSGISIVAWQSAGSFFISCDLNGNFGKSLKVGKTTTTLDKVIRNSDGTSILLGSSTELFLGNKAIGIRDGIILKVDSAPKIVQSIRSGEKKATRNWASATSSLLLGGFLKSSASSLATITKFATDLKPTWTVRYKSTSAAAVANGAAGTFYAAYENNSSGTLLTFDKNGKVLAKNTFQGKPILIQFNKLLGLYIYTGNEIYNLASKQLSYEEGEFSIERRKQVTILIYGNKNTTTWIGCLSRGH